MALEDLLKNNTPVTNKTTVSGKAFKSEFKNWAFNYFLAPFSWSRWADIAIFTFLDQAYLLQGRVNNKSNAKKFRITALKNRYGYTKIKNLEIEKLEACGLIESKIVRS